MVATGKYKLNHVTFALNKDDPEELAKAIRDTIGETIDKANAGMEREGFAVTAPPALTLVSHEGVLYGVLFTWGTK